MILFTNIFQVIRLLLDGEYAIDYLVGSKIQFKNNSVAEGECIWDFGDGSEKVRESEPIHKYEVAGTYDVVLEIVGEGKLKKKILLREKLPKKQSLKKILTAKKKN